jgi:hypothetical protein
MTIGELQNRIETSLFPENSRDEFVQKCKAREDGIKEYIEICRLMIMHHIEKPESPTNNLSFWKKEKIKKNMGNLIKYTEELAEDLDKAKTEEYCKTLNYNTLRRPFEPDIIFLIQNSYYANVVTDILWVDDVTIVEAMQISAGRLDIKELGKKLPSKIKFVNSTILSYLRKSPKYERHYPNLKEALNCYENKFFKACNLILMTTIEGLVRDLANFLNKKQGLNLNLSNDKFNSLDSLLRHGGWLNDIEISITKLTLITGQDLTLKERMSHVNFDPIEFKKVDLKTRLDFLRRRFKDDRDLILHGLDHDYGKDWNLFLNFSALSQVFEVIQYYDNIYKN